MDEAKKKQLQQILLLVVLLVIMVVAMTVALRRQNASTAGSATQAAASRPATDMDQTGITDADRERMGGTTSVPAANASSGPKLNPNMWKVYSINPPTNPFVQQESWYADTFRRLLPGYPSLSNSGFFDKPGEVLPDLNSIFGEGIDFDYAELTRDFADQNYSLEGMSADGKMSTRVTGTEAGPASIQIAFDGDGNVIDRQEAEKARRGMTPGDDAAAPETVGDNFFGELPPLAGASGGQGGSGGGMAVHGVSIHSGRSSALVMFNGTTRIVAVGDDLSAKYAVSKITSAGVEVKDTETGETKFLEIKAPSNSDKNPPASMMRGMNL